LDSGYWQPYAFGSLTWDGMLMAARLLLFLSVLFLIQPAVPTDYDHTATVGPQNGWLVIDGGGTIVPAVATRFVELAGGPQANFVVIPTASSDRQLAWHTP